MSANRNVYAYTPPTHPYPGYVSVNFPFGDDARKSDTIEITVRSPAKDDVCGAVAMMGLSKLEARRMALAILEATD